MAVGRDDAIPSGLDAPIYVCTRNDDLRAVIDKTPAPQRSNLVFLQVMVQIEGGHRVAALFQIINQHATAQRWLSKNDPFLMRCITERHAGPAAQGVWAAG